MFWSYNPIIITQGLRGHYWTLDIYSSCFDHIIQLLSLNISSFWAALGFLFFFPLNYLQVFVHSIYPHLIDLCSHPTLCSYLLFNSACWVIFHAFAVICWLFSKLTFFKRFFREHHQCFKWFGPRSRRTFCRSWSGPKLFAKVISRWQ